MARRVLPPAVVVLVHALCLAAPVLLTGCPIPPPLEEQGPDSGLNAPPVILTAKPLDLAMPGPIHLQRGDQRRMTLEVRDIDSAESHVYFYVDYDRPLPGGARNRQNYVSSCSISSTTVDRVVDCSMATICNQVDPADRSEHFLEAIVADGEVLREGEPAFRAFAETTAWSRAAWIFTCEPLEQ